MVHRFLIPDAEPVGAAHKPASLDLAVERNARGFHLSFKGGRWWLLSDRGTLTAYDSGKDALAAYRRATGSQP